MANPNIKNGLVPVRYVSGAPYNGAFNAYSVAAGDGTALFIGDPVLLAGTGQTINGVMYQDVVRAATTDVITGVVVGVQPVTSSSLPYRAASTQRVVYVADDPNLLFEIQETNGGTPFTLNDVGLNASMNVGAGSTTTGLSGVEIDNATEATTNTLALKIVAPVNRPDNAIGNNCKWLVRINRHRFVDQLAGV
jgi:hypothetical protein